MLTLFELFGAVFLFIWCKNGVPTPHFQHYTLRLFPNTHAGTPERGCITGTLPPYPLKGGATGAQVPFIHTSIVSNFTIYQDQFETNLLQLFAHT